MHDRHRGRGYVPPSFINSASVGAPPLSQAPARDVVAAHGNTHVLDLGEHLETVLAALAAGARALHPAERLAQGAHVLAVDEHHAGFDATGQPVGLADV